MLRTLLTLSSEQHIYHIRGKAPSVVLQGAGHDYRADERRRDQVNEQQPLQAMGGIFPVTPGAQQKQGENIAADDRDQGDNQNDDAGISKLGSEDHSRADNAPNEDLTHENGTDNGFPCHKFNFCQLASLPGQD